MLETADKVGYEKQDTPKFAIPEDFYLDKKSKFVGECDKCILHVWRV